MSFALQYGYITNCGIDCWNESMELGDVPDYRFLTNIKKFRRYQDVEISVSYL